MSCGIPAFPVAERLKFEAAAPSASSVRPLPKWLTTIYAVLKHHRQRQALLDLSDRMLDDIGITREHAERVASTPFGK